jgi:hypothetical protein
MVPPTGNASITVSHNHADGVLRLRTRATYILADGEPDCSREKTRSQKRKHIHTVSGQMTWASSLLQDEVRQSITVHITPLVFTNPRDVALCRK